MAVMLPPVIDVEFYGDYTLHPAEPRFKLTLLQLKGVAPNEIGVLG